MSKILIIFLLLALYSCNGSSVCDDKKVLSIGRTLTEKEISHKNRASLPGVAFIGDGLIRQLRFVKSDDTSFQFNIIPGDIESPYGSNGSDCVLNIMSASHDLKIRLKYNEKKKKYDILGWSDSYGVAVH